jgi:hypothetical protein
MMGRILTEVSAALDASQEQDVGAEPVVQVSEVEADHRPASAGT